MAFLLVVFVFAFICATVRPLEEAATVHLIVEPLAIELAAICPFVEAIAVDVVFDEVTFVA